QPEAPLKLLLRPVDVIVDDELADDDGERDEEGRRQDQDRRDRAEGMEPGMKDAAGMAVGALVAELVGRLQEEVEDAVLGHEHGEKDKDRTLAAAHRTPLRPTRQSHRRRDRVLNSIAYVTGSDNAAG